MRAAQTKPPQAARPDPFVADRPTGGADMQSCTSPGRAAEMAVDTDAIYKALTNPVRRQILSWLKTPALYFDQPGFSVELGVSVGLIEARVSLSQSTVSAHIAVLRDAGLIQAHRVGQWIFVRRNEAVVSAFLARVSQDI
jgi:DNA-binding transcriptional ArsR family regulator